MYGLHKVVSVCVKNCSLHALVYWILCKCAYVYIRVYYNENAAWEEVSMAVLSTSTNYLSQSVVKEYGRKYYPVYVVKDIDDV